MKLKSLILGNLAIGLLFNIIPTSFASTLSDDTRYETFLGNNITITDILEEDKVDIKIEGNTLVNAIGKISTVNDSVAKDNSCSFVYEDKDVRVYFKDSTIKENTTYTIFGNITKNTLVRIDDGDINNVIKLNINNYNYLNNGHIMIENGQTGLFSKTITTKAQNTLPYLETYPNAIYEAGGEFEIKNIMVVEGDYSNLNLDYFRGLQSSFENQIVTQEMIDLGKEKAENLGKYKVEYKATGKNKFNGKLELGSIDKYTGLNIDYRKNGIRTVDYIPVQSNTKYILSNDHNYNYELYYYDSDFKFISSIVNGNIITPSNCKYIKFRTSQDRIENDLSVKFQLEEGSTVTEYEPYKEFVNTFYLNSPLLKGDTIETINGQAIHVHRSKKAVFNGSELWEASIKNDALGIYDYYTLVEDKKPYGYILNDSLKSITSQEWQNASKEGIINGLSGIGIASSSSTLNEFKRWLSDNPITVVYELENPIYESIQADLSVNLFEGITHITNNSNIPTNMKVTVDRVLNRAAEAVKLGKENPTIENLSQARFWTNLARESIKKDELQGEINNITDIKDLSIEKKTVTANLDLYIKSKNSLTISLSTNAITFDGYSGVEDLEMLDAVEITVSSSLPYSLNAYMPTSISNADGSKVMSANTLNIRDNTESNYSQFINTTDRIVLKDVCNAGNNNIHNIDLKLSGNNLHKADVYKTVVRLEAEQK